MYIAESHDEIGDPMRRYLLFALTVVLTAATAFASVEIVPIDEEETEAPYADLGLSPLERVAAIQVTVDDELNVELVASDDVPRYLVVGQSLYEAGVAWNIHWRGERPGYVEIFGAIEGLYFDDDDIESLGNQPIPTIFHRFDRPAVESSDFYETFTFDQPGVYRLDVIVTVEVWRDGEPLEFFGDDVSSEIIVLPRIVPAPDAIGRHASRIDLSDADIHPNLIDWWAWRADPCDLAWDSGDPELVAFADDECTDLSPDNLETRREVGYVVLDRLIEEEDVGMAALLLHQLGLMAYFVDDWDAAAEAFTEASYFHALDGDTAGVAAALHNLGVLLMLSDDPETADTLLRQAISIRQYLPDEPGLAFSATALYVLDGDRVRALDAAATLEVQGLPQGETLVRRLEEDI